MANNCLVTKLKSVVQNDNLEKLDSLYLRNVCTPDDSDCQICLYARNQVTATISNGTFADGTTSKSWNGFTGDNPSILLLARNLNNATIEISSKYDLGASSADGQVQRNGFTASDKMSFDIDTYFFRYCYFNHEVQLYNVGGANIEDFQNQSTTSYIVLQSTNIEDSKKVVGNIESLVNIKGCAILAVRDTKCTGEITVLAEAQKNVRAANSTLEIRGNGIITYNGTPFSGVKTITFDGQGGYTVA